MPATQQTALIGGDNVPTSQMTGMSDNDIFDSLSTGRRLKTTKPSATRDTVADAIAIVAAGTVKVGEEVSWRQYSASNAFGAGRGLVIDAGDAGSRPAANPGKVIHVGSNGLYISVIRPTKRVHVYEYGATADDIGPALQAAWNDLKDIGGEIVVPGGQVKSSQQTFTRAAQTVKIIAEGLCKIQPVSTPITGFLWTFSKGSGITHVEFHNIQMDGQVTAGDENSARLTFDGVLVESSNNLILKNCFGRFVDGCSWELQRAHNVVFGLKTFKCGNATKFAAVGTGDPTTGDAFNDMLISGTSEKDINGWCFENGTILRSTEELKIHGSSDSKRGLQIMRVADYDIKCKPTLDFGKSGFIYVGDDGNSESTALVRSISKAPLVTRGQLEVNNHYNNNCTLTTGKADLVTIDCGTAGSSNKLTGLLKSISTAGAVVSAIGLAAGNAGASMDLTGVRFADGSASLQVDDRRVVEFTTMRGVPGAYIGTRSKLRTSFADKRTVGDAMAFTLSGNNEVPPIKMTSVCHENNAFQSVSDRQVIHCRYGSTAGANVLLIPAQYLLCGVDENGDQCPSDLERIQISATGLPGTHDESNYWRLDVYKSTALSYSLALCMQSGASSSSILPDRVAGNGTVGQVMDFWSGLTGGNVRYLKGNFLSCHLVKVGSPADIDNLSIIVQYSLRT